MAIDEVLLRQAVGPTLRVYRWSQPCVSCGYFDRLAEAQGMANGRPVVRRWTGGGMVEHGDDVTYTLVVPPGDVFSRLRAPDSYRLIHEAIARIFRDEGWSPEVIPQSGERNSGACFASPVQYDLVVGEGKIAGAAQRRTRWGLLHQGSIKAAGLPEGLGAKLAGTFGGVVARETLAPAVKRAGVALAAEKYGTPAWLGRF